MPHANGTDSPWDDVTDAKLCGYYERGLANLTIAELLNADGDRKRFTEYSVKNRATRLSLIKPDSEFTNPRTFKTIEIPKARDGSRVAILNDLQIPFHDRKTLRAVNAFLRDLQPDLLVLAGDVIDCYELSAFDKNPSRTKTLQDELDIVAAMLRAWSRDFPNARKIYIGGNHEDRLRRWLWRYGALHSLRTLELPELMRMPADWEFAPYGSQVNYLGFLIEHGEIVRAQAAYTARAMFEKRGSSGLCGHTHRFGVYSRRDSRGIHSYIENGCLCRLDPEYAQHPDWQQAMTYGFARKNRFHWVAVPIYIDGFRAEGKWWKREA